MKNYIEVQLKGGRPNKALESFLDNDRKVLSFHILWEDRTYDGGDKYYILNYFLSDGRIEVKRLILRTPDDSHSQCSSRSRSSPSSQY